jgi:hypothetical protein
MRAWVKGLILGIPTLLHSLSWKQDTASSVQAIATLPAALPPEPDRWPEQPVIRVPQRTSAVSAGTPVSSSVSVPWESLQTVSSNFANQ